VLQRIALCYLFAALLYLGTSRRTQMGVTIGLLIGYWALLSLGSARVSGGRSDA
jgi:predicted acyltransferase